MNSNNAQSECIPPAKNESQPNIQKLVLEDYTPVRTIEVSNFAEDIDSGYLRGYFEHASGPVANVNIVIKTQDSKELRVAYVTFVMPEDAAKMICTPNLPFNFKFTVKEAATAFQPKIDPNAFKFEQINDHCLLHIASYLNFVDIVNLGKSSTRLQSLVQLIYRKKSFFSFGTSTGDSSINASNLEFVLKELGSYIKSIKWTELESNHLDYLSQFCPNVTELKLINTWRLHMPTIKKNKSFFKNIEILDISLSSFFDSALQPITSSSRVKSLRLENCSNICGKFFCKWKKSKLKCLTLSNCRKVDCNNVFDFVRNNKLVKFSFDGRSDSIVRQDLSLSSECVSELVELELNYSLFTGDRVAILDFRDLKRVAHFTLTSTTVCQNVNKVLAAVSQIPTLRSLTVQQICIDADTLKCLGSFKTLQKIHFDGMEIGIGRQFFPSLHIHLPEITELIISPYIYNAQLNWFCEMISSLNALKTFSYAAMTWELLDMVLQEQVRLKRPTIEIKVWKHLFDDPKKIAFDVASKGAVYLSLYPVN